MNIPYPYYVFVLVVIGSSSITSYSSHGGIPRLPLDVLLKGIWPKIDSRIIGGSQAAKNEFPYQVSVQRFSSNSNTWSHSCGGSIINETTILTAAHCLYTAPAQYVRVVAGEYNLKLNDSTEQIRSVSSIVIHPSYNTDTSQNDIALIQLSSGLILISDVVAPIQLPTQRPEDATFCTVTGWGTTAEVGSISDILRKVDVPIVSDTTCKASYGLENIKPGMICAGFASGGADACQGDSGSPLVIKGTRTQVGIVSWGYGCAKPDLYGVYTQVDYYINWIHSNNQA